MVIRALTAVGAGIALAITGHTVVNLRALRTPRRDAMPGSERVSLLIPARNEQAHIEQTVRSALAQQDIDGLEVIVLNDGSTDRTSEILASIIDPRLTVITGGQEPLPPAGWASRGHAPDSPAAPKGQFSSSSMPTSTSSPGPPEQHSPRCEPGPSPSSRHIPGRSRRHGSNDSSSRS